MADHRSEPLIDKLQLAIAVGKLATPVETATLMRILPEWRPAKEGRR